MWTLLLIRSSSLKVPFTPKNRPLVVFFRELQRNKSEAAYLPFHFSHTRDHVTMWHLLSPSALPLTPILPETPLDSGLRSLVVGRKHVQNGVTKDKHL